MFSFCAGIRKRKQECHAIRQVNAITFIKVQNRKKRLLNFVLDILSNLYEHQNFFKRLIAANTQVQNNPTVT
jgi:hypothetical protein